MTHIFWYPCEKCPKCGVIDNHTVVYKVRKVGLIFYCQSCDVQYRRLEDMQPKTIYLKGKSQ